MAAFYFVTSWTPALPAEAGLSSTQSLTGGTPLNLGGVFGTALLGALAARYALSGVLRVYLFVSAALIVAFAAGWLLDVLDTTGPLPRDRCRVLRGRLASARHAREAAGGEGALATEPAPSSP
ncbi:MULTISPECIES: hypothetical protein [Streptomyces]|uniref:Uncharacterized protein n=1 Tax=Streptomyces fimbriatus TaxID=68197 RepID=A0ABW0D8K1_STRFI